MADKKISQLTSISDLDGSEQLVIVKEINGVKQTLRTTVSDLMAGHSSSSVAFPENPIEGDTFVAPNNDYYLFENGEWILLPKISIVAERELLFNLVGKSTTYNTGTNLLRHLRSSISAQELDLRTKFSVFDIYISPSSGNKIKVISNKEYPSKTELLEDIYSIALDQGTTTFEHSIWVVIKEKINKENAPTTTYSNGLYSIMKGRKNMTSQKFSGVAASISDSFPNFSTSTFYNGNLGRTLLNYFWGIDSETIDNNAVWYTRNKKSFYNQLPIGTIIKDKTDYYWNGDTGTMGYGSYLNFIIVNQPALLFATAGEPANLRLESRINQNYDYANLGNHLFKVLIYPCKALSESKYGFLVKPLGVDQVKLRVSGGTNFNVSKTFVVKEVLYGKTKHKAYVQGDECSPGGDMLYQRYKITKGVKGFTSSGTYRETVSAIKFFTVDIRTKTRSMHSKAFAKLHIGGANMAASLIPIRY